MKIAILETGHFQYALTQTEVFSECDITYFTTEEIRTQMIDYSPELLNKNYEIIKSIASSYQSIIDKLNKDKFDLLLISPVFDSYSELRKIVKSINCKIVLTTHNINTWFNGRFWSPNSYKDRVNMRSIIKHSDYIAVEDFIFNHLKSTNHRYFQENSFIYIPFTIFHESEIRKYAKEDDRLKIVLTGHIDGDRRRYEDIVEVINKFIGRSDQITFSFAGRAKGEYGIQIKKQLIDIQNSDAKLVSFFEDDSTADDFRREMETSDLVLSMSTKTFKGMGTVEFIGKTKPTAAIHDMMSYELPGFLPSHLKIPTNLEGSVFNYNSISDLSEMINEILENRTLLKQYQDKAKENSLNFTATEIRKNLPF
jgi:hypothetical protein|tara:strand:+ start:4589 stop:5689 length:1101 start_codon:yes stop_codon:yes gene_type:complete